MKASKNETQMPERVAILETTILNINSTLLDLKQDMKRGFDKVGDEFKRVYPTIANLKSGIAPLNNSRFFDLLMRASSLKHSISHIRLFA